MTQFCPCRTSGALALVAVALLASLRPETSLLPAAEARATPYGPHGISLGCRSADRKRRRRGSVYEVDMDDLLDGGVDSDDATTTTDSNDGGGVRRRRGISLHGLGREFDIFDTRGGETTRPAGASHAASLPSRLTFPPPGASSSTSSSASRYPSSGNRKRRRKRSGSSYSSGGRSPSSSSSPSSASSREAGGDGVNIAAALRSVRDNLPRIQLRMEPTSTLKIRKTFRIMKATVLRLGADFNYQLGVWQFRSSWEDTVIGGKLSLAGRELQLAKTWRLSVDKSSLGAQEDFVTSVRFRAAVDLSTLKAYARLGFRTERISPINVYEGFTFIKRIPLDGKSENIKLEIKANFALPEPEIEYSTENHRTFVGLGDVEVNVDELNLLFDF